MNKFKRSKYNYSMKRQLGIFGFGSSNSNSGAGAGGGTTAAAGTNTTGVGAQPGSQNSNVGTVPGATPAPTFEQNLDAIAQTWQAPDAAKKAALEANGGKPLGNASPFAHITDEMLTKTVSAARVSGSISQEALSGLFDGNTEKAAALGGILDQVFQAGIVMATRTAMKVGDTSIEHLRGQVQDEMLPSYMKDFQVRQAVSAANPMLSHPAYKPVFDNMVAGLSAQYPNASMQDIQAKVTEQLKTLAEGLTKGALPNSQNPNSQTNNNGASSGVTTSVFDDDFFKQ